MDVHSLSGRTVLILEAQAMVALEIASAFEDAGANVICFANSNDALRVVDVNNLSAAILDFGMTDGRSEPLFVNLQKRLIPFVLHTCSQQPWVVATASNGVVIPKPAEASMLITAVVELLRSGDGGKMLTFSAFSPPHSFNPSKLNTAQQAFDTVWKVLSATCDSADVPALKLKLSRLILKISDDQDAGHIEIAKSAMQLMRPN